MTEITSTQFIKGILGTDEILLDGVPQVAFIGRSNVGKSSLINAVTMTKGLAKTSSKPGKTTEINFFLINGNTYIVDLPGYGYARATPAEREKLKKHIIWYFTYKEARPRDVVLVLDTWAGVTDFDRQMLGILKDEGHRYVIAANKIDKLTQKELNERVRSIREAAGDAEIFLCSAETGKGIDAIRDRLLA